MTRGLISVLALVTCFSATAIVNIEAVRPKPGELGYKGQFKFDLGGSSGNTEQFKVGLGHNSVWNKGEYQNFVLLSYNYGESFAVKDTDKSLLHLRHVRPVKKSLSWEIYGQSQTDEIKKLKLRTLGGVGGRWETKTDVVLWAMGAGAFYSYEELNAVAGLKSETEGVGRGNFYVSMNAQPVTGLTSVLTIYFQSKLDEWADHHGFAKAMLKAEWSESLAAALEAELAYDSRPPAAVKKTDTTYFTSLIWKL